MTAVDDNGTTAAINRLIEFMQAMTGWEQHYLDLYQPRNGGVEAHGDDAMHDLLNIYGKYLTQKDRKRGRLAGPDAGYPPEFDPNQEKVTSTEVLNNRKITIQTEWKHPDIQDYSEIHRFTMVKRDEVWLLDKKESYDRCENKWKTQTL